MYFDYLIVLFIGIICRFKQNIIEFTIILLHDESTYIDVAPTTIHANEPLL